MNLRPHHHEELSKRFFSGASRDLGKERNIRDKEFYFDALNMRPSSKNENFGDMEKIGGSKIDFQYMMIDSYFCLVSFFVGRRIVSIWIDEDENLEPIIAVDNYIVCRSSELPFEKGSHIQYDVDAYEGSGFFSITNNETPPLIFDVQDMLDNVLESKYFVDFIRANYEINLSVPIDHPVFVDLVEFSGTSGIKLGQHEYYLRYTNLDGDKTLLSFPTPLIPVPNHYNFLDSDYLPNYIFPYYKTRGADASELRSRYGIKIKFRVNNIQNYDFVEILRASYANGEAIGYTPDIVIIKKIALSPGEFSIKEFIDSEASTDPEISITDIESQSYLATIKRAFTLRFYNRRLVLNNVEYGSFDMDEVEFKEFGGGIKVQAITELLSTPTAHADIDISTFSKTVGFKNAFNHAYKRTYMHSERYGFGILGIGSISQKSFVKPVDDSTNITMPQRRDSMPTNAQANSIEPVEAASVLNQVVKTYEVFDLTESRQRDTTADNGYVNILDYDATANYSPRRPKSVNDTNNQHYIRNITAVYYSGAMNYYNPYGYGERFHSLGMSLAGLNNFPDEMKAFSVVRTKKAGRIICQGLATFNWNLSEAKPRDEVSFYSPDIKNGVVSPLILSNIAANPSSYKVIIESPVGYFMDVYNAYNNPDGGSQDCKIDMILGCNVYAEYDARRINLGELATAIGVNDGTNGFTAYGKYRNPTHVAGDSIYGDGQDGTYLLTISEFEEVFEEADGVTNFRIKFTENLYKDVNNGVADFDNNQEFCEPFYIISIIDDSKEVADSNIIEYLKTEHYQKIEAIIGVSSGAVVQSFATVDERPDDFFVASGDTSTNKFIYTDEGFGEKKLYINITEKSPADIALIDADIADETDLFCGELIYGKFKATYSEGIFYVNFDADCTTPASGSYIYILYDNRFPIKFFGGDAITHNCFFPRIHRETDNSLDVSDSEISILRGIPYDRFTLNEDIIIPLDADDAGGTYQSGASNAEIFASGIRQMICSFPCTSYANTALAYNPHFPLVNYVTRPMKWTYSKAPSEQNIFPEYETDFPNEQERWKLGGFRIPQTFINLDYSKESITNIYYSAPAVGFTQENIFYNRYTWSLSKPNNTVNIPSWKTFLYSNVFDGNGKYGQGKRLFDQRLSNGQSRGLNNLILFTEETAFEAVTERIYIANADGNTLQTTGATGLIPFISEENNLGYAGMPNWLWRFSDELNGSLFYCDYKSFYKVSDKYEDISNLYGSKLFSILQNLPTEYSADVLVSKYLDTKNDEYGFGIRYEGYKDILNLEETTYLPFGSIQGCIKTEVQAGVPIIFEDIPLTGTYSYCMSNIGDIDIEVYGNLGGLFVILLFTIEAGTTVTYTMTEGDFSYVSEEGIGTCGCCELLSLNNFCIFSDRKEIFNWIGEYDYDFDYFCSADGKIYGFKDGRRYLIDSQDSDASAMENNLTLVYSPKDWNFVEFVRFNVSSIDKPDNVYFLDDENTITGNVVAANMRSYSGFEQYIPLHTSTRKRRQGKNLMMRISSNASVDRVVIRSATIQYKKVN